MSASHPHEIEIDWWDLGMGILNGRIKYRMIGVGGYGQVIQLHDKQYQHIAVKMIKREPKKMSCRTFFSKCLTEFNIQSKLNHPNISKVFYYFYHEDYPDYFLIFMEYIEGSDLLTVIQTHKYHELPFTISKFYRQLKSAVEYMRSLEITHNDLKPENIMITKDGDLLLIDFGFATDKPFFSYDCGSPHYAAPEKFILCICNQRICSCIKITKECDLWSCGVILYVTITRYFPFNVQENGKTKPSHKVIEILCDSDRHYLNRIASEPLRQIIGGLLQPNPTFRKFII